QGQATPGRGQLGLLLDGPREGLCQTLGQGRVAGLDAQELLQVEGDREPLPEALVACGLLDVPERIEPGAPLADERFFGGRGAEGAIRPGDGWPVGAAGGAGSEPLRWRLANRLARLPAQRSTFPEESRLARRWPSGLKQTLVTQLVCPWRARTSWPVRKSHTF